MPYSQGTSAGGSVVQDYTHENYTPVLTGTGLSYSSSPVTGQYVRIGDFVQFNIQIHFTNVTNFGTGQYYVTLPFAPDDDFMFHDGGLHDVSTGDHYSIFGDAEEATTSMSLWTDTNTAKNAVFNHNTPVSLATADYAYISGSYIAEPL
jgi:hypothetical protein